MDDWMKKIRKIVEQRQLCSYMNDTKWNEALAFGDRMRGAAIEWMKIRPQYLKYQGKLVPPKLIDTSAEFETILEKLHIPYEIDDGAYCIYGYR